MKRQQVYLFCQSVHAARRPVDGSENKLSALLALPLGGGYAAHCRLNSFEMQSSTWEKEKQIKIILYPPYPSAISNCNLHVMQIKSCK